MKKIGVKSLLNVLYATIILLPMFSIFGRLIYTQANPNAKDSYSDVKLPKQIILNNEDLLNPQQTYYVYANTEGNEGNLTFYVYNGQSNINVVLFNDTSWEVKSFTLLKSSGLPRIIVVDTYDVTHNLNNFVEVSNSFYFVNDVSVALPSNFSSLYFYMQTYVYTYNFLDNAFEYSIKTFTDDNNFGNVDFFGWFTNLFLNQSSTKNALYLNFVNWYLNYTLLVSSGYLLFLALIWFINYVRKILDKSMYHDFGGY